MGPQDTKMEPPGLQAERFQAIRMMLSTTLPVAGRRLKSNQIAFDSTRYSKFIEGAGGRGEALRFAAPPQGEPGVCEHM